MRKRGNSSSVGEAQIFSVRKPTDDEDMRFHFENSGVKAERVWFQRKRDREKRQRKII